MVFLAGDLWIKSIMFLVFGSVWYFREKSRFSGQFVSISPYTKPRKTTISCGFMYPHPLHIVKKEKLIFPVFVVLYSHKQGRQQDRQTASLARSLKIP